MVQLAPVSANGCYLIVHIYLLFRHRLFGFRGSSVEATCIDNAAPAPGFYSGATYTQQNVNAYYPAKAEVHMLLERA